MAEGLPRHRHRLIYLTRRNRRLFGLALNLILPPTQLRQRLITNSSRTTVEFLRTSAASAAFHSCERSEAQDGAMLYT